MLLTKCAFGVDFIRIDTMKELLSVTGTTNNNSNQANQTTSALTDYKTSGIHTSQSNSILSPPLADGTQGTASSQSLTNLSSLTANHPQHDQQKPKRVRKPKHQFSL